jgi:hypothetical protein
LGVKGRGEVHTGLRWVKLKERVHMEYLGVDGRIVLKWMSKRWDGTAWTGLICLGYGQVAGTCECGNELSGSIKCGEFLD